MDTITLHLKNGAKLELTLAQYLKSHVYGGAK